MSRFEGPQGIVTNGLVLNLDAGDPDSYTRSQPPYVEVLVVAGGGGGGSFGGGAGAGGLIYNSAYQLTNAAAITVTVGGGGAGATTSDTGVSGSNGSNSVFGSLTAIGGGGGGSRNGNPNYLSGPGGNGGSGGGSSMGDIGPIAPGGTATSGQGNNGGIGFIGSYKHGGGGGAGQVGQNATITNAGNGGNGQTFSISGTSTTYAGGGGGGIYVDGGTAGTGGTGGGGNGNGFGAPGNGVANTGGGGGGGPYTLSYNNPGGTGGSGIVIVRYPGLPAATGGTITYLNGYTIHTFTSSGTFTPYLWNDTSGNNNSGTLQNGVGFISNQSGGALTFDGSDDAVYIAPTNSTNISTTLSAECWVYYVSGNGRIFQKDSPSSTRCWEIGGYAGQFRMEMWHSNGTATIGYGNSLTVNGWMHLMLTFDGTNIKMYQNTSLITTVNFPGDIRTDINTPLYVGGVWPGEYFNGRISISRLYNRALSAAEITQNYNATKARFGL
jgi:hypothetical protein